MRCSRNARWLGIVVSSAFVGACGSSTDENPDANILSPPLNTYTQSECEQDVDRFAGAGCDDAGTYTTMKATCAKVASPLSTALCAEALARAHDAHVEFQTATIGCAAGWMGTVTDSDSPAAIDVLLGVLCVTTVNNNRCAGVACAYNADCPTGSSCNDATERCFSDTVACPGLPCVYNADCGAGLTCNNATGQCNGG